MLLVGIKIPIKRLISPGYPKGYLKGGIPMNTTDEKIRISNMKKVLNGLSKSELLDAYIGSILIREKFESDLDKSEYALLLASKVLLEKNLVAEYPTEAVTIFKTAGVLPVEED